MQEEREKLGIFEGIVIVKNDLKEGNLKKLLVFMGICALILPLMFMGCSDGSDGAQGPPGPPGTDAPSAPFVQTVESCVICHNGVIRRDGQDHQDRYADLYQDNVVRVTNLAYVFDNVAGTDNVTFNMTKAGVDFDCTQTNSSPDSLGIYFTEYDNNIRYFQFTPPAGRRSIEGTLTYLGAGVCQSINPSLDNVDLSTLNGLFVVYGRNESLNADQEDPELRFTRVAQNRYPFAGVLATAAFTADPYLSAANNDGCEKCHTIPFLKHGYIYGQVGQDPATDFYTCKACHLDDGEGGHVAWQLVVDDPPLWVDDANGVPLTPAQEAYYAYTTRLMNDVHMSHAMEFPYPQSMSNCVVCHENKLGVILTDANFVGETCRSCHVITGAAPGTEPETFYEKKPPALQTIMPTAFHNGGVPVDNTYIDTTACNVCHTAGPTGIAPPFSEIHNGYDTTIYNPDTLGVKYSENVTVTIDSASFADNTNTLTIEFSAAGTSGSLDSADIVPTVLVGLYGWDTKDYYVGPHERNFDDNGDGVVDRNDERNLEYDVGTVHPRFTTVSAGGGSWVVTADLSAWDNIITNGTVGIVRQVEIAVTPELRNPALDNAVVALNAPSRTFSLATNAFIDDYYSGANALVRVDTGCNNCHDALADTFHSPDRGGNIVVCRLCHITKDGGSHLEMQSRSIDSYAHGIHSFQPFDINNIDFSDPVQALHYQEHTRFAFPTLGRANCESCHNPGKFNVPDQSKSLPGVLSASEFPVIFENLEDFPDGQRQIQMVDTFISGPAARACGGCHRVNWINEDNAVDLLAFYNHTATNGYLVVYDSDETLLTVINAVEANFYPLP
jgi:OmcA/MtrC family decaheme c-type cytochrome